MKEKFITDSARKHEHLLREEEPPWAADLGIKDTIHTVQLAPAHRLHEGRALWLLLERWVLSNNNFMTLS